MKYLVWAVLISIAGLNTTQASQVKELVIDEHPDPAKRQVYRDAVTSVFNIYTDMNSPCDHPKCQSCTGGPINNVLQPDLWQKLLFNMRFVTASLLAELNPKRAERGGVQYIVRILQKLDLERQENRQVLDKLENIQLRLRAVNTRYATMHYHYIELLEKLGNGSMSASDMDHLCDILLLCQDRYEPENLTWSSKYFDSSQLCKELFEDIRVVNNPIQAYPLRKLEAEPLKIHRRQVIDYVRELTEGLGMEPMSLLLFYRYVFREYDGWTRRRVMPVLFRGFTHIFTTNFYSNQELFSTLSEYARNPRAVDDYKRLPNDLPVNDPFNRIRFQLVLSYPIAEAEQYISYLYTLCQLELPGCWAVSDAKKLFFKLDLLPVAYRLGFLQIAHSTHANNKGAYRNQFIYGFYGLLAYLKSLQEDDEKTQLLHSYWIATLTTTPFPHRLIPMSTFIVDYNEELGLYEGHPVVQHAISIGRQLAAITEPNNPFRVAQILHEKRNEVVDWSKMTVNTAEVGDSYVCYNPSGAASFASRMKVNLGSVPNLNSQTWHQMMGQLRSKLTESAELSNHAGDMVTEQYTARRKETKTSFADILAYASQPSSYYEVHMNTPGEDLDGAKLKCWVNHWMRLDDTLAKWTLLCRFITTMGNAGICSVGKNATLHGFYKALPKNFRLQSLVDAFDAEREDAALIQTLYDAVQKALEGTFDEDGLFVKRACFHREGTPETYMNLSVEQPVHQLRWLKGEVGDLLGLAGGPQFDPYSQVIQNLLLEKSLQNILQDYLIVFDPKAFVQSVQLHFNMALRKEFAGHKIPLSGGLHKAFGNQLLDYCELGDDEITITGLNVTGITQLLIQAGVLKELERPLLPW
jgi:hypothetical protein